MTCQLQRDLTFYRCSMQFDQNGIVIFISFILVIKCAKCIRFCTSLFLTYFSAFYPIAA